MTDSLVVDGILGLTVGAALGGAFFGGLLITVRALPTARHPALMAAASFLGRLAVVVGGLLTVAPSGPEALAGAAVGMIAVRSALVHRYGQGEAAPWT